MLDSDISFFSPSFDEIIAEVAETTRECGAGNDESDIEPSLRGEFYNHFNIIISIINKKYLSHLFFPLPVSFSSMYIPI